MNKRKMKILSLKMIILFHYNIIHTACVCGVGGLGEGEGVPKTMFYAALA
jgi:hypothetical protein